MPKYIAHVLRPGGSRKLGTFGIISGKYVSVKNFIRFALEPFGDSGMTYAIYIDDYDYVKDDYKHFLQFFSVPGEVSTVYRNLYVHSKVTLDGKPAKITGTHNRFAHIVSADNKVEFAWATIVRICAIKQGQFRS